MHTTMCNKSYYSPCSINTTRKGYRCMWNMIVTYLVLAYSVPSMKVLCNMAMASHAWR